MNDPGFTPGLVHFAVFFFIGSIGLFVCSRDRSELRFQMSLFFWAFAVRYALSVVIYQFGLVRVLGDDDSSGWLMGVGLRETWLQHGVGLFDLPIRLLEEYLKGTNGYRLMLATLFFLTDEPFRLAAAALNSFLGALTVVITYRIARTLFSTPVAIRAGWFACFFPSLIIWSAQTLKEPAVIFLETVSLYGCVRIGHERSGGGPSLRHIMVCVLSIVLLLVFRFYAAYIAAAALVIPSLLRGFGRGRNAMGAFLLLGLIIGMMVAVGPAARNETVFTTYNLNTIQQFRKDVSTGANRFETGSGVQTADIRTPRGFILGLSIGAAHLLLAPFPWELGGASMRMLMTLPELLLWWWLFFAGVLPGLRYACRHRLIDVSPMLLLLLGFGLLYALTFGNVGLVFRQRAQLLPYLLIFASVGLELRKIQRAAEVSLPARQYVPAEGWR